MNNAHLNLSADKPPFHTPGKMIVLISINREKVEEGKDHEKERQRGISAKKKQLNVFLAADVIDPGTLHWINVWWNICWTVHVNGPDDACQDTHHIQRHDDHKVDADTSARGGKLPVLLDKIPVEGSELLHRYETENHHSKHGCQDEGNLGREMMERRQNRGGEDVFVKNKCDKHR